MGHLLEHDQTYKKLKADFDKAVSRYVTAIFHSQRVREIVKTERRPVGSAGDYKISENTIHKEKKTQKPEEFRVYMGDILGWQKLNPSPSVPESVSNEKFDTQKVFDEISLKFFWDARENYRRCKEALLKYVYYSTADTYDRKVRETLSFEATKQLLGIGSGEKALEAAKSEIEKKCKAALAYYRSSPEPKSREVIIVLLKSLTDANLVGLESKTTEDMHTELGVLSGAGLLEKG
jgi:hypothetical protein